tara:strand:- start:648 stop:1172 length:525 start_codon:yes stop_codon:yes gene_type:complete
MNHNHHVNVNFPEQAPPTLTPRKRGCACKLSIIATVLSIWFLVLIALEAPFVAFSNHRIESRMRAAPYRRDHPPVATSDPVSMGIWDEKKTITSLQLVVCLSLALGIKESHVAVIHEGSFFYTATVIHEGAWVIEAVNDGGPIFLDALNAQSSRFGSQLVISHEAASTEAHLPP